MTSTIIVTFSIIIFIYFTGIVCDSKLSRAIKSFNILFILLYIVPEVISTYYLLTCGKNPGYVDETSSKLEPLPRRFFLYIFSKHSKISLLNLNKYSKNKLTQKQILYN